MIIFTREKRGFTLIELLIVCAIIGIMTSIVLTHLASAKAKGRDAKRIADVTQIEHALEVYFSSHSTYPNDLSELGQDKILVSVPVDPYNVPYQYAMVSEPTLEYHICATLELGYAGGIGKSGHEPISTEDKCKGKNNDVFDRYGP